MSFSTGQRVQIVDYPDDYTKQVMIAQNVPLRLGRKGTVIGDVTTKSGSYIRVRFDDDDENTTHLCNENELGLI